MEKKSAPKYLLAVGWGKKKKVRKPSMSERLIKSAWLISVSSDYLRRNMNPAINREAPMNSSHKRRRLP